MERQVSKEQIYTLKEIILRLHVSQELKKIFFALIAASDMLTKPVFYTVYSARIAKGAHRVIRGEMRSAMWLIGADFNPHPVTRSSINETLTNRQWKFSFHGGYFSEGKFNSGETRPGKSSSYTIWLSLHAYDYEAMEVNSEEVKRVELVNPPFNPEE